MTRIDGPPAGSQQLIRGIRMFGDPAIIHALDQARADEARAHQKLSDQYRIDHGHPPVGQDLFRGKLWVSNDAQDGDPLALALLDAQERRKEAERRLQDDLRAKLSDGRLIAWGRSSQDWDTWQQILPAGVSRLAIVDVERGLVRDRDDPRRSYRDVHLQDAQPDKRKQFALVEDWLRELSPEQQEHWRVRLVGPKKQRGALKEAAAAISARYPNHNIKDPARVLNNVLSLWGGLPEKKVPSGNLGAGKSVRS